MAKTRLAAGIALLAALALFVALNLSQAEVSFLVGTVRMPIALVVIFSAGCGAAAAILLRWVRKKDGNKSP